MSADDTKWVDIDLLQSGDRSPGTSTRLKGRVSMGIPLLMPFDPARSTLPGRVAEYLHANEGRYDAVVLSFPCSFASGDTALRRAVVAVALTCDDDQGEPPVAWGLAPRRLDIPIRQRSGAFDFELSVPFKAVVKVGEKQDFGAKEYILLGHGEGTSDPEWWFRRTKTSDFDGRHDLEMVIMIPHGRPASARLALSAAVRKRAGGIIPYTAALPDSIQSVRLNPRDDKAESADKAEPADKAQPDDGAER